MKKIGVICFAILLIGFTSAHAQGILDKIDRTLDKADKASGQAARTEKTGSKIASFFGKKKNKNAEGVEGKTTIKLNGVTFAALKDLNESIQGSKGVEGTKMKFNASGSTITVQHAGTTEDLFKNLQKASPAVFSEKNIESLDEGEITIKIK